MTLEKDPLLREIDRLKGQTRRRTEQRKRDHAASAAHTVERQVSGIHKFAYQFAQAFHWIYVNIIRPVMRVVMKPVRWLWLRYRMLWDRVVYYKDEYGIRRFSKTRAGLFLTCSVATIIAMPTVMGVVWSASLYAVTARTGEVVFLTNSQEILPEDNTHSVQGCVALPCSDENSIYFRVRPTLFHHIWTLASEGGWFFPDYVAAAVSPGVSQCTATSYGFRLKLFMRGLDIYPDLLQAECQPYGTDPTKS